jgi:hypothetical protein
MNDERCISKHFQYFLLFPIFVLEEDQNRKPSSRASQPPRSDNQFLHERPISSSRTSSHQHSVKTTASRNVPKIAPYIFTDILFLLLPEML